MVKLGFKKLYEDAKLPVQSTEDAACFDFFVHRIEMKAPNLAILYLGLASEFPKEYVLELQPRSSFTHKNWEMPNSPAKIDADYKGEIQVRLTGIPTWVSDELVLQYDELPFIVGDKCVQGNLAFKIPTQIVEVQELTQTVRGEGGFGSTGK